MVCIHWNFHEIFDIGWGPGEGLLTTSIDEVSPPLRDFSRQFFPQKFWVKSKSTPVFLSKNLSLEHKSRQILIHNKNTRLEQTLNFPENAYTFN